MILSAEQDLFDLKESKPCLTFLNNHLIFLLKCDRRELLRPQIQHLPFVYSTHRQHPNLELGLR